MLGADTSHIGPYELRGELGRGAMARVWRGWDPNLEREVAIKEPLFDYRLSADVREELGRRFVAEGRTAARLNHRGIVAIYAADVWDGRPAIVMELVEGMTLSQLMSAGPLPPTAAVNILDQLLDAVGYAHRRNVVHRDIKPDNIFVSAEGEVKLADFGIARIDDGSMTHATVAGTVLGTPGYMSPEQAVGRTVDARSDLFSVGVVAYEMLTGRNPFGAGEGTDATTLIYRIVHEPAPELPASVSAGLPADLRPAIAAALSKDPEARPATAEAFKALLHGATPQAAPAVAPQPVVASEVQQRGASTGRMPSWLPFALAFVVGLVAIGVIFISATSGSRGGGASAPAPAAQAQGQQEQAAEPAQEQAQPSESADAASPTLYLGIYEGVVALFEEGQSDPVETMDVLLSDLPSEDAAALGAHVAVSSRDEAWQLVESYRAHVEEAQQQEALSQAEYPPRFADATASSELPGDSITSYYGPLNVLNDEFTSSWNEGASGDGVGEWIKLSASRPQRVSGIRLVNGYPKSEDIYYKNNRCRDVRIELSDGATFEVTLEDAYGSYQTIDFGSEHAVTSIKISIASVYEGSKWEDTSICIVQAF